MSLTGLGLNAAASSVARQVRPAGRRFAVRLGLLLAAVFLGVAGLLALCWALIEALRHLMPLAWAALAGAGVLLAFAAICWAVAWKVRLTESKRVSPSQPGAEQDGSVEAIGIAAGEALAETVRNDPLKAAVFALGAGFVLGASPKIRRGLFG